MNGRVEEWPRRCELGQLAVRGQPLANPRCAEGWRVRTAQGNSSMGHGVAMPLRLPPGRMETRGRATAHALRVDS